MNHCASLWFCAALVSDAPAGFCAEEWGKWGLAGLVVAPGTLCGETGSARSAWLTQSRCTTFG